MPDACADTSVSSSFLSRLVCAARWRYCCVSSYLFHGRSEQRTFDAFVAFVWANREEFSWEGFVWMDEDVLIATLASDTSPRRDDRAHDHPMSYASRLS